MQDNEGLKAFSWGDSWQMLLHTEPILPQRAPVLLWSDSVALMEPTVYSLSLNRTGSWGRKAGVPERITVTGTPG